MPSLFEFKAYAHLDDEEDGMAEACYLYAVRDALDSGIPAWRFFVNYGKGDPKLNVYVYANAGAEYDNRNHEFANEKVADAFIRYQGKRRRELMYPVDTPENIVLFTYDLNAIPDTQVFVPSGGEADAAEG